MSGFICPVCASPLLLSSNTYICENNHCYDIGKPGYVNLLCSQVSSNAHHGDDKLMVRARRDFLERGYYDDLRQELLEEVLNVTLDNSTIVDAGCGEGWYTGEIAHAVQSRFENVNVYGIDISKDAIIYAAKRHEGINLAVASAFSLPFANGSADILISVFAPTAEKEFFRVLKPGGILFRVVPRERHLMELKEVVYEKAYENPPEMQTIENFKMMDDTHLDNSIVLKSNCEILDLFKMTPYYYKTGKNDQSKLAEISNLKISTSFSILKYMRK